MTFIQQMQSDLWINYLINYTFGLLSLGLIVFGVVMIVKATLELFK